MSEYAAVADCAGVIDSDGYIGVKRNTYAMRVVKDCKQPTYSERLCVKQVEPQAINLLRELFGGGVHKQPPSVKRGKPLYVWQITDKRAAAALAAMLPFLRIKRTQAENCLALRVLKEQSKTARVAKGRGHAGSARRPLAMTTQMESHYQRAKELNRVGC